MDARLILDGQHDGDWNMAVDEALLLSTAASGTATLRFYGWSVPTVSLGYFQPYADRQSHLTSRPCPLVRRATGGGAIVHDRELTYSFAAPVMDQARRHVQELYHAFHGTLIDVLAAFDISAQLCRNGTVASRSAQPFLCFQRRCPGDVLLGDHKIAGSAQRRHRRAVIQHGSVLLEKSSRAEELAGIREITGRALSAGLLADRWKDRLGQELGLQFSSGPLAPDEVSTARQVRADRFGNLSWTRKR